LNICSLLRKGFGKSMANSKGFSSVIGTIFMVIVVLLLSTNIFLWTLSQNTLYNQAVKENNQMEVDRLSEEVTASGVNYTVVGDVVSVEAELENKGPVSVEIVRLWVVDATMNRHGFSSLLNINLKTGNKTYLVGSRAIDVTIVGAASSHQFSSWLVTARGNVVTLEKEGGIIISEVTHGIGSIAMDLPSFKYYNVSQVSSSYILDDYPSGAQGYVVPTGNDIAFEVLLTDYDQPNKKDIKLFSGSILWAIFPVTGTQPRCAGWYIVNVYDNGTIAPQYTPIVLSYGVPTRVFFASKNDMNNGFNPSSATDWCQSNKGPAAINLMLVGEIGNDTYGQNVPFVSIYFTP